MAWETYKGLQVPTAPTGDAGINLKEDLKTLADRDLSASAVLGSVLFVGGTSGAPVLAEDPGQFYWDSASNRLGLGTGTPLEQLHVHGNGKALLMGTASTVAEAETYIYFGTGLGASGQWQRIRYRYGSSNIFFERKSGAGAWSPIMMLDWTTGFVGIGTGTTTPVTVLDVAGPATVGAQPTTPLNPPAGRASIYVDSSGASPVLKVRFADGTVKTIV